MKLLSLILIVALNGCGVSKVNNTLTCDELNIKTAALIDDYYSTNKTVYIDSTLNLLNEGINRCDDYKKLFSLRKLSALSIRNDYDQAINFINEIDKDMLASGPYYLKVVKLRFQAAQMFYERDSVSGNNYLQNIVDLLDNYIKNNEKEINELFSQSDISVILQNSMSTALIQYANYLALIDGRDDTANQLNLLFQSNGWNMEFYDMIINFIDNEDILIFVGI